MESLILCIISQGRRRGVGWHECRQGDEFCFKPLPSGPWIVFPLIDPRSWTEFLLIALPGAAPLAIIFRSVGAENHREVKRI